jgi:hypothetical protein
VKPRLADLLPAGALVPGLGEDLDAAGAGGGKELLARLTPVGPGVWSLPLLTAEGCEALLEDLDARGARDSAGAGPNSMHSYGAVLADLGLGPLASALRAELVAPLGRALFASLGGADLTAEHGFLAEYGADADEELGYHVDDSVVTLNLCLGEDFSGTELYFRGVRCDEHRQTPWSPSEAFELEHEPGQAILHAGRHRHGVHPLRRGRRRNLILWCQGETGRRLASECGPWCGHAS